MPTNYSKGVSNESSNSQESTHSDEESSSSNITESSSDHIEYSLVHGMPEGTRADFLVSQTPYVTEHVAFSRQLESANCLVADSLVLGICSMCDYSQIKQCLNPKIDSTVNSILFNFFKKEMADTQQKSQAGKSVCAWYEGMKKEDAVEMVKGKVREYMESSLYLFYTSRFSNVPLNAVHTLYMSMNPEKVQPPSDSIDIPRIVFISFVRKQDHADWVAACKDFPEMDGTDLKVWPHFNEEILLHKCKNKEFVDLYGLKYNVFVLSIREMKQFLQDFTCEIVTE